MKKYEYMVKIPKRIPQNITASEDIQKKLSNQCNMLKKYEYLFHLSSKNLVTQMNIHQMKVEP